MENEEAGENVEAGAVESMKSWRGRAGSGGDGSGETVVANLAGKHLRFLAWSLKKCPPSCFNRVEMVLLIEENGYHDSCMALSWPQLQMLRAKFHLRCLGFPL